LPETSEDLSIGLYAILVLKEALSWNHDRCSPRNVAAGGLGCVTN